MCGTFDVTYWVQTVDVHLERDCLKLGAIVPILINISMSSIESGPLAVNADCTLHLHADLISGMP